MEKRGWLKVPFSKQSVNYTCGPVSMKMVLEFFGVKETEIKLAHQAHTNKTHGTGHREMINLARRHGFYCYVHTESNINTIKHFIHLGLPVIINHINPTDNDGHYAVISGYYKGGVVLADPWNGKNYRLSDRVLNTHWIGEHNTKKWLLVVSKKPIIQGKQYNPK